MTTPRITVVIPFRDRLALLREAVASLSQQTLSDWEAVLADDGSDPATLAGVAGLLAGEPRLRLLTATPGSRSGACAARTAGASAARSPLVVFLDSDDVLYPGALAARVAAMMADATADFVVSDGEVFDVTPGDVGVPWNQLDDGGDALDRFLAADTPWQTAGPTWRRESLARLGEWPVAARSWQDWEYHVRALCLGLAWRLRPAVDYGHRRQRPDSLRSRHDDQALLVGRADTFQRVGSLLAGHGLLTELRARLLRGLCLRFALKCARLHGAGDAALGILAPVASLGLADAAWQGAALGTVRAVAAGDAGGEDDPATWVRFPELAQVCRSTGRQRARDAPGRTPVQRR